MSVLSADQVAKLRNAKQGSPPARAERPEIAAQTGLFGPPLSDVGNAQRLVAEHGADLLYVPGLSWLVWDGQRWALDRDGEVPRRTMATCRTLLIATAGIVDDAERKRWAKFALASENAPRIRATIELAASNADIVASAACLDADPDLLNVENGTIDLRNGKLREHRRDDLVTKLAPVTYDPAAQSARWTRFLHAATRGDDTQADYLQRAVGYTLTGHTSEQIMLFAHGPGATGKTTFLETIRAVLGDYAAATEFQTFLAGKGNASHDLARLPGARMVVAAEVPPRQRFDPATVKSVTGGDTIAARFLYREAFEYRPQFKLWLAANERPAIDAHDDAAWRRIRAIPFLNVVPEAEQDRDLKRALTDDPHERAAVLAWAIAGCIAWRERGLEAPEVVRSYTAGYRRENDHLGDWLTTCCDLQPNGATPGGRLRSSYEKWCSASGEEPLNGHDFTASLRAHGFSPKRTKHARLWTGIALQGDGVTHGDATTRKSPHARVHGKETPAPVTHRHPSPSEDRAGATDSAKASTSETRAPA